MQDRRKSDRNQTHLYAQWETTSGVKEGTIVNCSMGGCFVQVLIDEPGNEPVRLAIQLPNGKRIQLWGTVAYYLPTMGFGLHFTHSAEEDPSMFESWCAYLQTQQIAIDASGATVA